MLKGNNINAEGVAVNAEGVNVNAVGSYWIFYEVLHFLFLYLIEKQETIKLESVSKNLPMLNVFVHQDANVIQENGKVLYKLAFVSLQGLFEQIWRFQTTWGAAMKVPSMFIF